jgi:acetolactate synthase-1/3 small subunit
VRHIISVLVENKSGVLAHVAGLFSSRGFNIDSLAVGETEDPRFSRMTIVSGGDEEILEQIIKQLRKLINVVKVQDISRRGHVERDLALVKVHAPPEKRTEIMAVVEIFRGKIVDVSPREMMVEIAGPEEKVTAFVELLRPLGVKGLVRTGVVAMPRGESGKANGSAAS